MIQQAEALKALEEKYKQARSRAMENPKFMDEVQKLADKHDCGEWFELFRARYGGAYEYYR